MPVALTFPPRLLPAPAAAHYLGVSESTLRTFKIPRRELGAKRLYDRIDLDAFADSLATEGQAEENSCDQIFGATG